MLNMLIYCCRKLVMMTNLNIHGLRNKWLLHYVRKNLQRIQIQYFVQAQVLIQNLSDSNSFCKYFYFIAMKHHWQQDKQYSRIGKAQIVSQYSYQISTPTMSLVLIVSRAHKAPFSTMIGIKTKSYISSCLFYRFLNWLCRIKTWKYQQELWKIARPLLCHLYLESFKGNHTGQSEHLTVLRTEYYEKLSNAHLNGNYRILFIYYRCV